MRINLPRLKRLALILWRLLPALSLHGLDLPTARIQDDSSLRVSLADSWFKEAPGRVLAKRAEIHTLSGGSRIRVSSQDEGEEFLIILARELDARGRAPGSFRAWAQGSWILIRSKDGNPLGSRIRVFLKSDPYTYVQFRPFAGGPGAGGLAIDDKCQMDVVLYDGYIVRSLPLPVPFDRLLTLPVEAVLSIAGDKFPRRYFDPIPGMYKDQRDFISAVRSRLPEISFADDGAMDENGRYVFIETLEAQDPKGSESAGLNCSGFAKWVVDGILRPVSGSRLPVAPLKRPFGDRGSSFTDPWEESRDPFFGLDWCRNLAARAASVLRSPAFAAGPDEIEVRRWPFAELVKRGRDGVSPQSYPGFLKDAGFGIEGLHALLYTLAVDEPGYIYLAAVNNEISAPTTSNPKGLPRMRQYFHIAVLVPYFNENGVFQVGVFESAAETSFTRFKARYPGHFVNLSRASVEAAFDP
jgi:hypothetical protein